MGPRLSVTASRYGHSLRLTTPVALSGASSRDVGICVSFRCSCPGRINQTAPYFNVRRKSQLYSRTSKGEIERRPVRVSFAWQAWHMPSRKGSTFAIATCELFRLYLVLRQRTCDEYTPELKKIVSYIHQRTLGSITVWTLWNNSKKKKQYLLIVSVFICHSSSVFHWKCSQNVKNKKKQYYLFHIFGICFGFSRYIFFSKIVLFDTTIILIEY